MAGKLRVMLKSDDFFSYKASFLIKSAYFTLPSRRLRCNYLGLGNMMTDMVGKMWMPSRWKIESHADLYAIKSADFTILVGINWDVSTCLGWVIWWLAWLVNSECDHSSGKLESCNISGIDRGNISEIVLEISIQFYENTSNTACAS